MKVAKGVTDAESLVVVLGNGDGCKAVGWVVCWGKVRELIEPWEVTVDAADAILATASEVRLTEEEIGNNAEKRDGGDDHHPSEAGGGFAVGAEDCPSEDDGVQDEQAQRPSARDNFEVRHGEWPRCLGQLAADFDDGFSCFQGFGDGDFGFEDGVSCEDEGVDRVAFFFVGLRFQMGDGAIGFPVFEVGDRFGLGFVDEVFESMPRFDGLFATGVASFVDGFEVEIKFLWTGFMGRF